jgi:hypothetical protein
MPPRRDQHMDRSLRREIAERDVVLALGDELGSQFTARDAAENAIFGRIRIYRVSHIEPRSSDAMVRSRIRRIAGAPRRTSARVCQNSPKSRQFADHSSIALSVDASCLST